MRIGIDASRANSEKKTGVEYYSYNLINELKKIDKENQYILYSQNELKDDLNILPENFKSSILKWKLGKMWTQIRLLAKGNSDKLDVMFIPAGIIPIAPFRKYRIITTIHDVAFLRYPEYFSKKNYYYKKLD